MTGDQLLGLAAVISSTAAAIGTLRTSRNVNRVDEKVTKVDIQTNSHLTELSNKLDIITAERDQARRTIDRTRTQTTDREHPPVQSEE